MAGNDDQTTRQRFQAVLNPAIKWLAEKWQIIKPADPPNVFYDKLKQWAKPDPWRALILALLGFPALLAGYSAYLKLFDLIMPLQLLWTIIGAVTGLSLLFWRGRIMAKQADTASKQVAIAERTQLEDIFSRAVEQVSNNNLPLRLAGLALLSELAEQHQDQVDLLVVKRISNLLCDLLRYPPPLEGWQPCDPPEYDWWKEYHVELHYYENKAGEKRLIGARPDIAEIIKLIVYIKAMQPDLKIAAQSVLLQGADMWNAKLQGIYLSHAQLQGADLSQARLQGAYLSYAQLQVASLWNTKLQGADLSHAQLQGADLSHAQLQGARFEGTNISACDLSEVKGLDEKQFSGCYYEEGYEPPKLPEEFKDVKIECRKPKSS